MFNYNDELTKAGKLEYQASIIRTQASKASTLKSMVGDTYTGTDATSYEYAVDVISDELNSIANKLDNLADIIRSVALQIKTENEELATVTNTSTFDSNY